MTSIINRSINAGLLKGCPHKTAGQSSVSQNSVEGQGEDNKAGRDGYSPILCGEVPKMTVGKVILEPDILD
jgi:hypothetical protein